MAPTLVEESSKPDKGITYADFVLNISPLVIHWISDLANKALISSFCYEGFSIGSVYDQFISITLKDGLSYNDICKELSLMLGLYHVRGPNVGKMNSENSIGKKDSDDVIQGLISRYGLSLKKTNASSITLPRLSMVFPQQSLYIYSSLDASKRHHPVKEQEIGLPDSQVFSCNFTPCLISASELNNDGFEAIVFTIYNIYQSYLSYRTRVVADASTNIKKHATNYPHENFSEATKYAFRACTGTQSTNAHMKTFKETHEDIVEKIKSHFESCFYRFVNTIPITMCEETPTKYHVLYNLFYKKNMLIRDLPDKDKTYDDLLVIYNSI